MPPETARFALAAARAVSRVIDGDAIVIDTISGRYYSLEGTGETAWTLLVASHSVGEVAAALRERYEVGAADVEADVSRLADELLAENLIEPAPEGAIGAPQAEVEARDPRLPYSPPLVTIFRDMEDLLAFDPPLPSASASVWTAEPDKL
jgi:hypothetical protein